MRPSRQLLAVATLAAVACSPGASASMQEEPLVVAAASDLLPAFTELGQSFERATGTPVTFTFGSSGQLAQQVAEGAPVDLFASADAAFVDRVLAAGVGDPDARATYAVGRLTIWATSQRWGGWGDLAALADDPEVGTIAIANPDHAPYGRAAAEALRTEGLWDAVAPRLVYGANIADTQRLADSGNADAAIVALSLALAAEEAGEGSWVLLDDGLHAPLQQDLLVTSADPERAAAAAAFVEHVSGPEGRAVMRRYGFLLPGEEPPAAWGR